MKRIFQYSLLIPLVFLCIHCYNNNNNKDIAESNIWIHSEGYTIGDIIGFSDTIKSLHRISKNDSIYDKTGLCVGTLMKSNNHELIIKSINEDYYGYYKPYLTKTQYLQQLKDLENAENEKKKKLIAQAYNGIVISKKSPPAGCLDIRLNSSQHIIGCSFDSTLNTIEVGDSISKPEKQNICIIYKKNGSIINASFLKME